MVRVVVFVALDEFLLGMPQGIDCLFCVSAKLKPSVVGLCRLNVMDCIFSRAKRIPQIGMMNFVTHGDPGYQNG
jgi:hypothetical protein